MLYLVTGGAGFIGSHIVEEILKTQKDSRVRVLDNFSSGKIDNLVPLLKDSFTGSRLEVVRGDVRDPISVTVAMKDVDVVFHQAAMTSVRQSVLEPAECNAINVDGTLNVLQAAHDAKVSRVVFASSASVYGDNPVTPKRESMLPEPLSPYAASKLMGEMYCRIFSKLHGLETVCFRYFNVFGPRQDPNSQYAAAIPKFADRLLSAQQPIVFGDGLQTRDFVFVKDVARANIVAGLADVKGGTVCNLGTGTSISLLDLLATMGQVLGRKVEPIHTDAAVGDVKHSRADISEMIAELGFRPSVQLLDGLRMTLESMAVEREKRLPELARVSGA